MKLHTLKVVVIITLAALSSAAAQESDREIGRADELFPIEEFRAAHGEFGRKARRVTPDVEIGAYYIPGAKFSDADEELDIFRYELDALVPLPVTRDSFLLFGGHAGARDYKVSSASGFEDERVYNLGLRFGGGTFVNERLAIQGYWQPSIYSDFDGAPYSDDWKLWYGTGLVVYRSSEAFFWKGGIMLSDAVNSGVIPLAGFAWLFSPEWRIDILAPRQFEISHAPGGGWDLSAGVRVDAEEYTIRQDEVAPGERIDIRIRDIRLYLGALHKLDSGLSYFARAGVAYGGEYEWTNRFEGDMEPAPFVSAGLGWHF